MAKYFSLIKNKKHHLLNELNNYKISFDKNFIQEFLNNVSIKSGTDISKEDIIKIIKAYFEVFREELLMNESFKLPKIYKKVVLSFTKAGGKHHALRCHVSENDRLKYETECYVKDFM